MSTPQSHFVCVVIYRRMPRDNSIEFLVIDYHSVDPRTGVRTLRQVKFPGGTNSEYPEQSVEVTRDREALEETGLIIQKSKQIWMMQANQDHTKYGFLVNLDDCRGVLRTKSLDDNGDVLGPPDWTEAVTLGRRLFPTHQGVYLAACRELGIL